MALKDILDQAFEQEEASNRRLENRPTVEPTVAQPAPPPVMPPNMPSSPGVGLESLIPLLMSKQGGGQGKPSLQQFSPGQGGPVGLANRIANWIESKPGFQVSGLEGFQGTGQISTGHIDNSQHYTGHAGDVGYYGGGRFPNEMRALDWLYNRLNKRWGDRLTELIWRAPDHWDHLHYGTRPGG